MHGSPKPCVHAGRLRDPHAQRGAKDPMLRDLLKPEILQLIEQRDWPALRDSLVDEPAPEVADLLLHLRQPERVLLFRTLERAQAARVFAHLELDRQDELLRDLSAEETRELLAGMQADDRTHLLGELPGQATQRLLNLLDPEDLEEARWLLGYPENSVGRLMTPEYVAVRPDETIAQALAHIRAHGSDSETIDMVYVVDADWKLLDDIELRRFILADPTQTVSGIMDHSVASVVATADREHALRLIRRYDTVAVPVVDTDGVLLGIVTVDDMFDVAEQEATEDFHRVGSVGPIRTSLRDATIPFLFSKRIGWLLALVFMNIFSGAGIAAFETTIEAVVALVFFLPLLIDSGGNAGSQSATLMVRALATGDVQMADWFRLLGKELRVALLLGVTMATGVAAIAWFRAPEVLVIVPATMVLIVLVGSLIGMSLPFLLTRLRLDPATASAPLITSLADISGVLIYFSLASWYFSRG
jgi:magnesium transporter